jgi:hypothetical protein
MSRMTTRTQRGRQYFPVAGALMLFAFLVYVVRGHADLGDVTANVVLGQVDFFGSTPSVGQAGLNIPGGVAVDRGSSPNHLYVVDTANNRVLGWNSVSALSNGAMADLVIGQTSFITSYSGAGLGSLNEPGGAAVDSAGNLFVADTGNNRVLIFDTPYFVPKPPPCSVATPCMGQVATAVIGQPITGGNLCNRGALMASATSLCNPASVAFDINDNLYVADSGNNRVLEFLSPDGPQNPNCIGTGSNPGCPGDLVADVVFGQGPTDNIFATGLCGLGSSSFCGPSGVVLDSVNNVYVSDSTNNRVLEFDDPSAAKQCTGQGANLKCAGDVVADRVYGQGPSGDHFTTRVATGDSGANNATSSGFNLPTGIAVDRNDSLYVIDSSNNRILKFSSPLETFSATLVFGQGENFASNNCAATDVGLCYSNDIAATSQGQLAFDSGSDLFVVDSLNSRALEYLQPVPPTATPTASSTLPVPTPTPTPSPTPTSSASPTRSPSPTRTPAPTPTPTLSGKIKVTPDSVTFKTIRAGQSTTERVTISNLADTVLSGTVENDLAAPFSLRSAGGFDLTHRQKKKFTVVFTPTMRGEFSAQITIDSSDQTQPVLVEVKGSSKQ